MLRYLTAALAALGLATASPAEVIGADDRKVITVTEGVDWGTVAIVTGPGEVTCTGTVIGPVHVLTAAHCVWDEDGEPKKNLTVIPGLHMALGFKPLSRWHLQAIWVPRRYKDAAGRFGSQSSEAADIDIAILEVIETEGRRFATVAPAHTLGTGIGLDRSTTVFKSIAYAADGGVEEASQFYHVGGCSILPIDAVGNSIVHDCEFGPASSGMALWSAGAVRGVHYGGASGDGNWAAMLTPDLLGDIESAMSPGGPPAEEFQYVWLNTEPFRSVDLVNPRSVDIEVVIGYRNLDYELKFHELIVPAGHLSATRVQTGYDEVLLTARAVDGSMVFEGPVEIQLDDGRVFHVQGLRLVGPRLTDEKIDLPCERDR